MRYLFKRKGSDNYYIKLQPPGQKLVERSLGTPDLKAAEIAAADLIKQHKMVMYRRRQARVTRVVHGSWLHEYEPGLHTLPDGRTVMATERDLTFSNGERRPNGGPAIYLTGAPLPAAREFAVLDDAWAGKIGPGPVENERPKLVAAKSHADDAILETYLKQKCVTGAREREARDLWHVFKTVVDKPLRECTREEGRAVVAALGDVKSATARRKLVPLVAAVNLAIAEGRLTFNPFIGVVAEKDDSARRVPFDDDDIKLMRANLHKLDKSDALLIRLLACTGVRRGEAFAINREQTENGVRFVTVGTKTDQSLRRVPLPKDLISELPKITGPLFAGRLDSATKRLRAWLDDIGITDPNKAPAHSFRHRCKDKLRAAGCPLDVQYELLGHDTKTIAAGYGHGSPMPLLKKWLDRVGF